MCLSNYETKFGVPISLKFHLCITSNQILEKLIYKLKLTRYKDGKRSEFNRSGQSFVYMYASEKFGRPPHLRTWRSLKQSSSKTTINSCRQRLKKTYSLRWHLFGNISKLERFWVSVDLQLITFGGHDSMIVIPNCSQIFVNFDLISITEVFSYFFLFNLTPLI